MDGSVNFKYLKLNRYTMNKKLYCISLIGLFVIGILNQVPAAPAQGLPVEKQNRLIVLSDIEAEIDDTQSFVRLLLYSNEIDLKGLIATTSVWKRTSVAPEAIKKVIHAYARVLPNLLKHDSGFPDAEKLLGLVKQGLPTYGMTGVGEGKDSEGSDWIVKVLEEKDERPLWISVWGGSNTLAQALLKIKRSKSAAEAKKLIAKLRVYTISDQDDSGIWMRNNFPDLFYIVSPGDDYFSSTWIAITSFIKGVSNEKISNSWIAENIQQGHGPLGVEYPDVAWGMEGDTPSWLALIPNGLNVPGHPEWGGWGGRYEFYKPDFSKQKKGNSGAPFEPESRAIWTNAIDSYTPFISNNYGRAIRPDSLTFTDNKVSLWRWRDDFQNDFAARMDWCTKPYNEANHPPIPVLSQADEIIVRSGEEFTLDAIGSADPDGDHLSFLWFSYPEAGSYKKKIETPVENGHSVSIKAPTVDKPETAHFILKVSDKGTPSLSRYKRIIVTIMPK
jgi:hypothetical protein